MVWRFLYYKFGKRRISFSVFPKTFTPPVWRFPQLAQETVFLCSHLIKTLNIVLRFLAMAYRKHC